MKKMLTGIIVFSLLLSIPFSQDQTTQEQTKQEQTKFGIGLEFHTFPASIIQQQGGTSLGLYVPIDMGTLIIEPHISYYSSSYEADYDDYPDYEETNLIWSLSAGVYKPFVKGSLKSYAGVRIGKQWSVYEETNAEDVESESLIIAPTIGAEYFISENFSFGGECMYSTASSEDEENDITIKTSQTRITPVFIVRFYF